MTNYKDMWKRHYNDKPIVMSHNKDYQKEPKKDVTLEQFQMFFKKRGYTSASCCNKCDGIIMLPDGTIPNFCWHCGNPLIVTNDVHHKFD